ncbi:MAG: GtrA family protein [Oscillospiraceae bacterium]|nr:GtrA family protein [Oscillospiraceae bacterium]
MLKEKREIILYIFFGGLTTLVSIGTQYLADYLGANTALATTISWICAVTFAFFVNKIFVFQNKSEKASGWFKQALGFYAARLTTYVLEMGFMLLTVEVLLWNMHLMKIIAQVFVLVGNYLLSKFWVFRKK